MACNASYIYRNSSQKDFRQFKDLANFWLPTGKKMTVQLIGCYTEIEENKLSDKEAEKYAKVLLGVERGQTQSFSNDGQELKKANDNH